MGVDIRLILARERGRAVIIDIVITCSVHIVYICIQVSAYVMNRMLCFYIPW